MEDKAQISFNSRRFPNVLFLPSLFICVVLVISGGIYYVLSHKNSNQFDGNSLNGTSKWIHNEEIDIFRQYLRLPTISNQTNFERCVDFLRKLAIDLDLKMTVYYQVNDKNPIVLMTWKGSQQELPAILLNSHMNVAPVIEEDWIYPPFAAEIDDTGKIFGRGAQDMKSIGMQYLAAIRSMKRKGIHQLKRTIHLTYVSNEETSEEFGFGPFIESEVFRDLNVGFGLTKGNPSKSHELAVFFHEKTHWEIDVTAFDYPASTEEKASNKLNYVISKFFEFKHPFEDETDINLTILKDTFKEDGFVSALTYHIHMHMALDIEQREFELMIIRWARDAGENVVVEFHKGLSSKPTRIDDTNPYWISFKQATDQLHLNITPSVYPVETDARFLRNMNIPALGFSPLMNTNPKLQDHDEYVNVETYLKGIQIYEQIIEKVANSKMQITDVNHLKSSAFVNVFENVVELWPKAAENVESKRPFRNIDELVSSFSTYLENISVDEKVAILQSHPDLAGVLLDENKLSSESAKEQASAGLNQLTVEKKSQLVEMNAEYAEKFGFPFVICVRQNNKIDAILEGLQKRLPNAKDIEIANGIEEVKLISQLRIEDIVHRG